MQASDLTRALKRVEVEIALTRQHLVDLETVRISLVAMKSANGKGRDKTNGMSSHGCNGGTSTRRTSIPRPETTLPPIAGAFWLEQLGRGESTTTEIVARALAKLDLPASSRTALYVRAPNWLNFARNRKAPLVAVVGKRDGVNVYKKA